MTTNYLIQTLATFSRKEMTRFVEFVHSPYHNKHVEVRQLVHFLGEIYPDFTTKKLERTVLFQHLFPRQPHDQNKLAVLFTYANRLLEAFIIIEKDKTQIHAQHWQYIQYLRDKKDIKRMDKVLRKAENTLEKQSERNSEFYYWQYRFKGERDSLQVLQNSHIQDDSLPQKQRQLDYFYLAEKLRDACEMQVRRAILKVDYNTRLLDAVLKEVGTHQEEYATIPIVKVYYQLYQLLTQGTADLYHEVRQLVLTTEQFFTQAELRTIYNYLQNFCIAQINRGARSFLKELFTIYQRQLEKGLLIDQEVLSEWHYKNIVTVGLRLQEMEWTEQFIETYKMFLPATSHENAYSFNLASYHYAQAAYGKTLALLTQVEYKQEQYNIGAKALLLRTYYDQGEDELLLSLTQAFRQFLGRNRSLNTLRVNGLRNFVRLIRALAKMRMEVDFIKKEAVKKEQERLKQTIEETQNVINKEWLLERLAEM